MLFLLTKSSPLFSLLIDPATCPPITSLTFLPFTLLATMGTWEKGFIG